MAIYFGKNVRNRGIVQTINIHTERKRVRRKKRRKRRKKAVPAGFEGAISEQYMRQRRQYPPPYNYHSSEFMSSMIDHKLAAISSLQKRGEDTGKLVKARDEHVDRQATLNRVAGAAEAKIAAGAAEARIAAKIAAGVVEARIAAGVAEAGQGLQTALSQAEEDNMDESLQAGSRRSSVSGSSGSFLSVDQSPEQQPEQDESNVGAGVGAGVGVPGTEVGGAYSYADKLSPPPPPREGTPRRPKNRGTAYSRGMAYFAPSDRHSLGGGDMSQAGLRDPSTPLRNPVVERWAGSEGSKGDHVRSMLGMGDRGQSRRRSSPVKRFNMKDVLRRKSGRAGQGYLSSGVMADPEQGYSMPGGKRGPVDPIFNP